MFANSSVTTKSGIHIANALQLFHYPGDIITGVAYDGEGIGRRYSISICLASKRHAELSLESELVFQTLEAAIDEIHEVLEEICLFGRQLNQRANPSLFFRILRALCGLEENQSVIPSAYFRYEVSHPSEVLNEEYIDGIIRRLWRELELSGHALRPLQTFFA